MAIVTLGDVAIESRETWKSDKNNIPIVGLEHLEPGEISLSKWDINSDNTFTKMFRKGQVLLGRRRVYLRKAVIAPTDGICSGDITVIEAIPGKILPELLPFIIQNDRFFDYAMQGSAGSLSPRVKWEHLKDYKFQLPNLEEQKALADKLWSAYNLKSSYNKLLAATDEMVKSQFIEMFGADTPVQKISDVCDVRGGSTPSRTNSLFWDNGDVPWFTVEDIYSQGKYIRETKQHITKLATKKCFVYPKDTVVICCTASIGECALAKIEMASNQQFNGMMIKDRNKLDPQFLLYVSSTLKDELLRQAGKTTIHFVSRNKLEEMQIPVPSMDKQQSFVAIMEQADKSKFELGKSIESIDAVIKSLINS